MSPCPVPPRRRRGPRRATPVLAVRGAIIPVSACRRSLAAKQSVTRCVVDGHATTVTLANGRKPPTATEERQYPCAKGASTDTDNAGDPNADGHRPPRKHAI